MEDLILIGLYLCAMSILIFLLLVSIKNDIAKAQFYKDNEEINLPCGYCAKHDYSFVGTGCKFCWSDQVTKTILKQFENGRREKNK